MKKIKPLISLILSMVLALLPILYVNAGETQYDVDCPYIYIHGFMGSDIYKDVNNPSGGLVWPPQGEKIKGAVFKALPYLGELLITRNYDKFADKVFPLVTDMFYDSYLGYDGNVRDNSGVIWSYPAAESINSKSQLKFVYDWRIDPIEVAAQLNDYIDYVLECSGSDYIVAEAHSYGGVILTTYAKLYGTSKIKSWLYNSTAVFGEDYTGDLFTGGLEFDAESLTSYLDGVFDFNENEKLFDFLFKVLYKTGITASLCRLVNHMVDKIGLNKIGTYIIPMFGGWLSIWSMVPDDKIDDSYDYIFNTVYKDDGIDHSGLRAKVDDYNTRIRPYKAQTLNEINENANLYVIARYGYSAMFMTKSWRNEADTVIDLKYASFGATAAPHGETLSDEQLSTSDGKYISPQKNIDASTCMFPEQTWFIRHMTHGMSPDCLEDFGKILLYSDGQATVETYEDFPRYLYYSETADALEKDNLQ